MTDYYSVLGVTEFADEDVIAAAYRALAKKYHPDTGTHRGTASAQKFQEIQEAFEVLGNQRTRAEYDEQRKTADQDHSTSEHINESKGGSADHQSEKSAPDMAPNKVSPRTPLYTSIAALLVATIALSISAYLLFPSDQKTAAQVPSAETAPAPSVTADTGQANGYIITTDDPQIENEQSVADGINEKVGQGHSLQPKDYSGLEKGKKQVYSRIVGEQELDAEYDAPRDALPLTLQREGKGSLIEMQPVSEVDVEVPE